MSGDRIDWVLGKPAKAIAAYLRWREAVVRADQGDLEPLIALFRSEEMLGPEAAWESARLPLRRGSPATEAPACADGLLADRACLDLGDCGKW